MKALDKVEALDVVDLQRQSAKGRWDALARVRVGGTEFNLLIEEKKSLDPRGLEAFLDRWERTRPKEGIPVLVAEYVGPSIRRRLEAVGIGWLDHHGNIHIEDGEILVHVERPLPRGAVPRPRGRLFSTSGGRVAQALLERPGEHRNLDALASTAHVSVSTVSRALDRFEREGLVERGLAGWFTPSPPALLDAWLDAFLHRRGPEIRQFFSPDPPSRILGQLVDASADLVGISGVLLTGLTAAELIEPLVPSQRVDAYVFPPMKASELAAVAGWIPTEEVPTVRLLLSPNEGPRVGEDEIGGHRIVGRAQLILDLMREGGRAVQVVDALRKTWGL